MPPRLQTRRWCGGPSRVLDHQRQADPKNRRATPGPYRRRPRPRTALPPESSLAHGNRTLVPQWLAYSLLRTHCAILEEVSCLASTIRATSTCSPPWWLGFRTKHNYASSSARSGRDGPWCRDRRPKLVGRHDEIQVREREALSVDELIVEWDRSSQGRCARTPVRHEPPNGCAARVSFAIPYHSETA